MQSGETRSYNLTTLGTTIIPIPKNPNKRLVLKSILINTKGASSNTLTIYDSNETLGANVELKKGTIDTTVLPGNFEYEDLMFNNGIYIVNASGTSADVTVLFADAI